MDTAEYRHKHATDSYTRKNIAENVLIGTVNRKFTL